MKNKIIFWIGCALFLVFALAMSPLSLHAALTVPTAAAAAQPKNPNLDAVAGVTSAADKMFYFTGSGTGAVTTVSSYSRTFLAAADAATAKGLLSLAKADVGLSNVDNTSDATKNSATATLTNKTISGASNTLSNVNLASQVTGTLPLANGGTGGTTQATALAGLGALGGRTVVINSPQALVAADRGKWFIVPDDSTDEVSFSNGAFSATTAGAGFSFAVTNAQTIADPSHIVYLSMSGGDSLELQIGQSAIVTSDGTKWRIMYIPFGPSGNQWTLRDSQGIPSIDWANRQLGNSAETSTVDWKNEILSNHDGQQTVGWTAQQLWDASSGYAIVDWGAKSLTSESGVLAMTWGDSTGRAFYDIDGGVSVLFGDDRQLNARGAVLSVDWGNRRLFNGGGNPSLDWDNRRLGGDLTTEAGWTSSVESSYAKPAFSITETSSGVDKGREDTHAFYVNTTTATPTTIYNTTRTNSTTVGFDGWVTAHRTGGSAGTADDSAFYHVTGLVKVGSSGTLAIVGSVTVTTVAESQAGWDLTVAVVSGELNWKVTGATNNNISWSAIVHEYPVNSF